MSLNHWLEQLILLFPKKNNFLIIFNESVGANGPPGVVASNLNPRGMVGRIYVVDHYVLQHIKYRSCRLHGFREDFLKKFPIIR